MINVDGAIKAADCEIRIVLTVRNANWYMVPRWLNLFIEFVLLYQLNC